MEYFEEKNDLIQELNPKPKKQGWKFWLAFWFVSAILLSGWFLFLQYKQGNIAGLLKLSRPIVNIMPTSQERKQEIKTIFDIIPEITKKNQEQTFLILFQNNTELRPGGGFIGAFGIMKIKDGKVSFVDTHDTNVFDSGKSTNIEPPYPMGKMLNIKDWELRDSNWSPDFPTNASKAEYFYHLEGGQEQLNGVVAISTEVLVSFLEIVGPVTVEGYPGEYSSENAVAKLQYQVERGYTKQGIEKGKRKYIMKDLAKVIIDKAQNSSWSQKKELLLALEKNLKNKDIMIYFKDEDIQDKIRLLSWSGEMKVAESDYLMMVDANLGALKTDRYIQRSFEYSVDLSQPKPQAVLKITYENTARARDWMTSDYHTYLRVYVPKGSWLNEAEGAGEQSFGEELGKKYFGFIIDVPIGKKKTIVLKYDLPEEIGQDAYSLLIQKQSGIEQTNGTVEVKGDGQGAKKYRVKLTRDALVDF